jgi:2-keto-3-deoxy-L-rhamnonate aldolase RhmA
MPLVENWLKFALASGKCVSGLMVSELKTPMLGAILESAGADFAIIDQEHGAYGPDSLASLVPGFRGGKCVPLVRVPDIRREHFLTPLELGVGGILVPRVETRAQAEDVVGFGLYPPQGERGVSLNRAHTGFRRVSAKDYLPRANADVLLMVQIETKAALDNMDDILSTSGIDMAFIGPSDLSVSLGIDSSVRSPDMRAAIDRIIATARRHKKAVGIQISDTEVAAELVRQGLGMVSCTSDLNALLAGLGASLGPLRAALGPAAASSPTR